MDHPEPQLTSAGEKMKAIFESPPNWEKYIGKDNKSPRW